MGPKLTTGGSISRQPVSGVDIGTERDAHACPPASVRTLIWPVLLGVEPTTRGLKVRSIASRLPSPGSTSNAAAPADCRNPHQLPQFRVTNRVTRLCQVKPRADEGTRTPNQLFTRQELPSDTGRHMGAGVLPTRTLVDSSSIDGRQFMPKPMPTVRVSRQHPVWISRQIVAGRSARETRAVVAANLVDLSVAHGAEQDRGV